VYLRFDYFFPLAALVTSTGESVAMAQGGSVSLKHVFTVVLARFKKYVNTWLAVVYHTHRLCSGGHVPFFDCLAWGASMIFVLCAS
jgi:hypothetical protein